MKRLVLYTLILNGLTWAPVERADVGKLAPVELVMLDVKEQTVVLTTDTGDKGAGETVEEALLDMKGCSRSYVYLDTAAYLLITESGKEKLEEVDRYLKDRVRVCLAPGDTDLKAAAEYLRTHAGQPTLRQWKEGAKVPAEEPLKNFKKTENNP